MQRLAFVVVAAAAPLVVTARAACAAPDDLIARPLVLDRDQVDARLSLEIDTHFDHHGAPMSLSPDVWFGVLPQLTIGIIHSDQSVDRIGTGASFCIDRWNPTCQRVYHGSGVDALYGIVSGSFALAAHARFLIREIDPIEPAVTLGAALAWHRGRWAISGDPYVQLGLANRAHGNRAEIWLPIVFAVQPARRWAIELHTGWNSDIAVATDGYYVPAALRVRANPWRHLDVGLLFGFTSILGPQNDPKDSVVIIDVGWRT